VKVLAALALACGLVVASAPSSPATPPEPCDENSWDGGTSEWCGGDFVHRDFVYDDRGADTGALQETVAKWPTAGDVDHRTHGQSLNSADLVTLRLARHGNDLDVRFELNTLLPTDATIAGLAIDHSPGGGGEWPAIDVASAGWDDVHVFGERDAAANTITGTIPVPDADVVRLQAVIALGDGTPMNVAFRTGEHGGFNDAANAAMLASGDISGSGVTVDLRDLGHRHDPAALPAAGFHARFFRSAFSLGEGMVPEGIAPHESTALFHFLGSVQPYTLYVPTGTGPFATQLRMHGAGGFHGDIVTPGIAAAADVAGNVVLSPLGRGPENSWVDWAARDALDALTDAQRITDHDPERVLVTGYSSGGGGTMFLSTLFPDRFAAGVAWVPFTGDCLNGTPAAQGHQRAGVFDPAFPNDPAERDGCPLSTRGNSLDYLGNVRHVPQGYLFGAADEAVWANHQVAALQTLDGLGYEFKIWEHAAEHGTFARLDSWGKEYTWAAGRTIVRRPQHVTYTANVYNYRPEAGFVPDGAYWVDDLRPIDGATGPEGDMVVDLVSHRCTHPDVTTEQVRDHGTDPLPWVGFARVPSGTVDVEPGNLISGTLTNVASITIDRSDACFAPGEEIRLAIQTDPSTVITFRD
jgi:dienelactone hydrolase